MTDKVKATEKDKKTKPTYLKGLEEKFEKWTGIKDDDIAEAINDLSGDLYLEMRKLTSRICTECESAGVDDKVKEYFKEMIDEAWKNIIDKQKVGLDKMCIVVKKYIK